jgi:hypothetical protein
MRTIRRVKLLLAATFLLASAVAHARAHEPPLLPPEQQGQRHVDLVIALDTSSSMDGLIDAARQKLWDVVSLLGTAKPQPVLRVGVVSYGNTGYAAQEGWVRKDIDLTTDLDQVYAKLFALRTNGGSEYVARAVKVATEQMQWDQDPKTLKIIFVAGNEPANQDPVVRVEDAVGGARQKNIFVNAIYCGSAGAWETAGWAQVASLGKGQYAAIDHTQKVAIATPMDAELARLSAQLSSTYVGFGRAGRAKAENQMAQDANASSAGVAAAASRAVGKTSSLYRNDDWDLVDAKKGKKVDVKALAAEELPAEMRAMAPAEREAYVEKKAKERAEIQKRIAELSKRRDEYIRAESAKAAGANAKAVDSALNGTLKRQAESAGFAF